MDVGTTYTYIEVKKITNTITVRDVLHTLNFIKFTPHCNHQFLEGIDEITSIQFSLSFGS
jgi:hypothetical protein